MVDYILCKDLESNYVDPYRSKDLGVYKEHIGTYILFYILYFKYPLIYLFLYLFVRHGELIRCYLNIA